MTVFQWIFSALTLWIGVSLFLTLGLIIAQLNDIQKASSFANLLNITLAILGGLWFPVYTFPDWLQSISKHMPTYNLKLLAIDLAQNKGEYRSVWLSRGLLYNLCEYCFIHE